MGNLEGIDSMNCTTIVEGNVQEMVAMGDEEDVEREQSTWEKKRDREKGWKI